ncbi:MAG TPA: cation:proton antiporter [Vicinamibacterales bacterium]|nr:cation:proton antiporter [Vicinamibacterales bacterium]
MHEYELIVTLTAGLAGALLLGYITQRLGLSPIVGYLLAGMVVGPNTPGLTVDAELAQQLAEIGVILLMFGVGLQFHLEELLAVRGVAVPGALVQCSVATLLGAMLATSFGWSWGAGIVFGIALAVASTVVVVRVLSDNNTLHTPAGHIAVGWLVVEDLLTVLAIVLLPAVVGGVDTGRPIWMAVGWTILKVSGLVFFTGFVGSRVIPWVLERVAVTRSRELFTLTVLVIALGIAVGSSVVFGVSMALGAFLAGMIVGRSDFSLRAASDALPMRDAFAVLFFVSVGLLLDPASLFDAPMLFAGTLAIILIATPVTAFVVMWLLRQPFRDSITVAIALAQIGEFSFILSTLGRDLGLLTIEATNTIVAASIVSIVVNPLLFRTVEPIVAWVTRHARLRSLLDRAAPLDGGEVSREMRTARKAHRAVLVGYGPTGKTVARLLKESGIEPTIIELNIETVRAIRDEGLDAVYGDATRPETLIEAGVDGANTLILTSAGMANSSEVIRAARETNPRIRVLARAPYLRDLAELREAGADTVFAGEGEVALAFVEDLLSRLGATAEQIDRERARAHTELFGEAATRAAAAERRP